VVQQLLRRQWSPEQISRELQHRFADCMSRQLSPESIYQAVYDRDCGLVRDRNCIPLRRRRRRRKPHRRPDTRRRGALTDMTMIDQRPASVDDRTEAGYWEGDRATRGRTS
jgi:IS30 family transposase